MLRHLALAASFSLALAAGAFAAPPSDDDIDSLVKKLRAAETKAKEEGSKREKEVRAAEVGKALEDVSFDDATFAQIEKIVATRAPDSSPDLARVLDTRLGALAKDPGVDGAKAAEMRLKVQPMGDTPEARKARTRKLAERAAALAHHPAVAQLIAAGGSSLFTTAGQVPAEQWAETDLAAALTPLVTPDLPSDTFTQLRGVATVLGTGQDAIGTKAEPLRKNVLAALDAAIDKAAEKNGDKPDTTEIKQLKDVRTLARVVGQSAPAITVEWSSTEEPIKSFADFKGKVVMVDFWATWCGPCVAAFPKVRELQTRYNGYPVVILGVTSHQGARAMERKPGAKPTAIDCKDNPAKEEAAMKEFMKDMDMTWPVVFSKENVFNPEFGVTGIPHLTIIDPSGKIRFNCLRPNAPEEVAKIDALLKEFKLPYPEVPFTDSKKD